MKNRSAKIADWSNTENLEFPNFLLVEGSDDQLVIRSQIDRLGLEDFLIFDMHGKDRGWSTYLKTLAQDARFRLNVRSLGLVKDADTNAGAAFDSCRHALQAAGFPAPSKAESIVGDGNVRSGVFVMPGNSQLGALEDLILGSVVPVRANLARTYIKTVAARTTGPKNRGKGELQSYLAGLPSSPKTLAVALANGECTLDDAIVSNLRDFLVGLAGG